MKIIKPRIEILDPLDGTAILKKIEACGRICYKSESLINKGSSEQFVSNLISRGHESVLEHFSITVKITCDRGVSHEIVRHRLASYSQESTRYCNYSKAGFEKEITVIEPCFLESNSYGYEVWKTSCENAEKAYFDMLAWGCSPEQARAVLPNSLKTEIIMTANLREWRHFFKLRTAKAAHPQMREITRPLLKELQGRVPIVFDLILEDK